MKLSLRSPKLVSALAPTSPLMKISRRIALGVLAVSLGFVLAGGLSFTPQPTTQSALLDLAEARIEMAEQLTRRSVMVATERSTGSGTLFSRTDPDGNPVHLVWTAAHVVGGCRSVYMALDPQGRVVQRTKWAPVSVVIPVVSNGQSSGTVTLLADVIQFSNFDTGDDLAILRIRDSSFPGVSTQFWLGQDIPPVGTEVSAVGAPLGRSGANTFSTGLINFNGRIVRDRLFDQVSTVVYGGASGSGIFSPNGRYIGMLTMMYQPQMGLMIPVRRIQAWAARANVLWAMDLEVPMPSQKDLEVLLVENDGTGIPATPSVPDHRDCED